ncbi:hypothetical protein KUTeg_006497 [Tegillarca granosa]|uniref:Uncharacterized protein n=1 Tax=Tegillarca granosa TaxID=220873 RepID=A0ABQ9FL75_TEGGR|nr:hypothetical protein KUTeg_006497 [Tegillarca granosa]
MNGKIHGLIKSEVEYNLKMTSMQLMVTFKRTASSILQSFYDRPKYQDDEAEKTRCYTTFRLNGIGKRPALKKIKGSPYLKEQANILPVCHDFAFVSSNTMFMSLSTFLAR